VLGRAGAIWLVRTFDQAHPITRAVVDLGDVSDGVASASGDGCPLTL